jgi:hypothetical protein
MVDIGVANRFKSKHTYNSGREELDGMMFILKLMSGSTIYDAM